MENYDFSGYATKNDIRCSDGRIIKQDAFKNCDGMVVPLMYQHNHTDPSNVLGHVLLENRDDGVYCYGTFNHTEEGERGKELVRNGDLTSLSIYANHLEQQGPEVVHGMIREVSLVLAGANPEAFIDNRVIEHGELTGDENIYQGTIYFNQPINLAHSDTATLDYDKDDLLLDLKSSVLSDYLGSNEYLDYDKMNHVYSTLTDSEKEHLGYEIENYKNECEELDMLKPIYEDDDGVLYDDNGNIYDYTDENTLIDQDGNEIEVDDYYDDDDEYEEEVNLYEDEDGDIVDDDGNVYVETEDGNLINQNGDIVELGD